MRWTVTLGAAMCLASVSAVPASAQVTWTGFYVGAHAGGGFKTHAHVSGGLTAPVFSVDDFSQPSILRPAEGTLSTGINLGGHIGINRQFNDNGVLGAEFGVGMLRYQGDVRYSLSNDTLGGTRGDISWTAMARAGWVVDRVMPYIAFGFLGTKNTAHVIDTCVAPPCGSSSGEGSNATWATPWIIAFGAEFAVSKNTAAHPWMLRFEWMQLGNGLVTNSFMRTVSGIGIPAGTTARVDVNTNTPNGILRAMVNIRLKK